MTALSCLANLFSFTGWDWYWKFRERNFDQRHGVDTGGLIPIEDLEVAPADREAGWGYMPTQPEWFHQTMAKLRIDYAKYVLVDYGSGKGRALLFAATLPFRKIIGVEFCEQLHEIAVRNIAYWQKKYAEPRAIESICADAANFDPPAGPTVFYFYNPFKAETMRRVVARIEQSYKCDPRPLVLVYANPTCKELFDETDFLLPPEKLEGDPEVLVYRTCEAERFAEKE